MKTYKVKAFEDEGLLRISLVDTPAIKVNLMAFSEDEKKLLKFVDEERQEIYAPALIPNLSIYRKEVKGGEGNVFFDEDTIKFLHLLGTKKGYDNQINLNHEEMNAEGIFCFESWIIEDAKMDKAVKLGFDLPKGTLMKAYKIESKDIWNKVKNGELTGLSIEAWLDKDNFEEVKDKFKVSQKDLEPMSIEDFPSYKTKINLKSNKQMNKKSIFQHIKSLFVVDGSTEYATGFYGTSLEMGSIITDAEGNPHSNAEFEYEGQKYKTDDMGAISEIEPIEMVEDEPTDEPTDAPNEDMEKMEARILELETENATLKAELEKSKETQMSHEARITKLKEEVVEAAKATNFAKEVDKPYEKMTRKEKLEYNRNYK